MAHKTITISEEAYNALAREKTEFESFTDVILRITRAKVKKQELLLWLDSIEPNEDLASAIEEVYKQRNEWKFRS
ncbi:MAG: antitoxin VapB family protein [Candidatus Hodarchaeales archaeon]